MAAAKLTVGSPVARILKLAGPIALGLFTSASITAADAYFVNSISSQHATAFALTTPVTALIFVFWVGLGTGVSALVSRAIGADDERGIQRAAAAAICLVAPVYIISAAIFFYCRSLIFAMFSSDAGIFKLWDEYIFTYVIGSVSMGMFVVVIAILRSLGRVWIYAAILAMTSLANIVSGLVARGGIAGVSCLRNERGGHSHGNS